MSSQVAVLSMEEKIIQDSMVLELVIKQGVYTSSCIKEFNFSVN